MTQEIAIIGHPNEGKSSVLSTLAEDDSVRISPVPGETFECRTFPVIIDGREVLKFTDTPGFQNPQRILAELKSFSGNSSARLKQLRSFTASSPEFIDDHELMVPLERGAGIIYVVDGSRPVRNVDRSEMEILRQIGKPRMAVINCKNNDDRFLEEWKEEFRKNFNSSRVFNAHRATYAERIELLEALKAIDQDWHRLLSEIIEAFKKDWKSRTETSAAIISSLLSESLSLKLTSPIDNKNKVEQEGQKLLKIYSQKVSKLEKAAQQQIRALFKHNIFSYQLPPYSILQEDLFNKKTWQILGLTPKQMAIMGGISGAAVGAGIDIAALGHGLGLFTAVGGISGAVSGLTGGNMLNARASVMGIKIAGPTIQVGPAQNITLLFILINRALLYYQHTINWAHGRRDYPSPETLSHLPDTSGFTRNWPSKHLKICHTFFKAAQKQESDARIHSEKKLQEILFFSLMEISRDS